MSFGWDLMVYTSTRDLEQDGIAVLLPETYRELGLFAAQRRTSHPSEATAEPAGGHARLATQGHIGANWVADRHCVLRYPSVGAAHDPEELVGEPWWPVPVPAWHDDSAGADHVRVHIRLGQRGQPPGLRDSVVVKKRNDVTTRVADTGVPCARQTFRLPVGDHGNLRERVPHTIPEQIVVVDDYEGLEGWWSLCEYRGKRLAEQRPSAFGVCAYDDRYRRMPFFQARLGRRDMAGIAITRWTRGYPCGQRGYHL